MELRATSTLKWLEYKEISTNGRRKETQTRVYIEQEFPSLLIWETSMCRNGIVATTVRAHYGDREHPAATSHEDLMFMYDRTNSSHTEETKQRRLWHIAQQCCLHEWLPFAGR